MPPVSPFRVRVVDIPPTTCGPWSAVELGIQKQEHVLPATYLPAGTAECTGELRLKHDTRTGAAPVFLGPFAFGPPSGRFVYLSWSGVQDGKRVRFRRAKLPLGGITWEQVERVLSRQGVLVATIAGRARDGGPACATVPLAGGGWEG